MQNLTYLSPESGRSSESDSAGKSLFAAEAIEKSEIVASKAARMLIEKHLPQCLISFVRQKSKSPGIYISRQSKKKSATVV